MIKSITFAMQSFENEEVDMTVNEEDFILRKFADGWVVFHPASGTSQAKLTTAKQIETFIRKWINQ